MVTNLVQNAIVHDLPTGGTATVNTEARGDTIQLRVENGRRLPPEPSTDPHRTLPAATERVHTDEHAGVGLCLGLAIVHSNRPRP